MSAGAWPCNNLVAGWEAASLGPDCGAAGSRRLHELSGLPASRRRLLPPAPALQLPPPPPGRSPCWIYRALLPILLLYPFYPAQAPCL